MVSYAWLNLAIAILQVVTIFIFIRVGTSVITLAYLLLGIQAAGAIFGGIFCTVKIPGFWKDWHFSSNDTIDLFIACMPIAIIAIFGILYQKLSLAMLSFLGSASMVGWFSVAARAIEAAHIGHFAAFTVLYPAMANTNADKDSIRAFKLSWRLLLFIAGGGVVFLFLFARPLVEIFFGTEYRQSISVLKILSFTLIPYTISTFLSLTFLAEQREKAVVHAQFVSLIILFITNLWLIPRAGQIGAAWAFLFAETLQSCLLLIEWKMNPSRSAQDFFPSQGDSHELSDLSQ